MIYTSYYGLVNALKHYKIKMVCISAIQPSWLPWISTIKILQPPVKILDVKNVLDARKMYIEHLENIGVNDIKYELAMQGKKDFALLCYEKYSDITSGTKFCHRRFFAAWWELKTGIVIPEFDLEKIKALPVPENMAFKF